MNFHSVYRLSFYLMLALATLVLSIDATDQNRIAMLYPVAVGFAGAMAFFSVDRNPKLGLSKTAANVLGLASVGLTYIEYRYDENLMLLALAHWLVYLQLIKMFRPKTFEDDWILFLNGLIQVLVGGVMSQSDAVGIALFSWGLSALWVLGMFTLLREVDRGRPTPGTHVFPTVDHSAPYPGLIDGPFLLSALRVAGMTLALGGVIFLVMPRRSSMGSSMKGDSLAKHLTGFDDEVQLGQLGEILENDSVVMTIEQFDQDNNRIVPQGEQLWRGVGMARYDRGRWRKQHIRASTFTLDLPGRRRPAKMIRQQIKLEPTDNPVLFALRPILWAESPIKRFSPDFNEVDGSIYRSDTRPIGLDYIVISSAEETDRQPKERFPGVRTMEDLLSISPELRDQIRPLALKVVEGIDPKNRLAIGRKLESYLRDSGLYTYSLQMDVVDRTIDPVADFLLNRKEGHCEYYASALTLLLRSIGIPARLVNGFKGGDWNDLAGVLNVRQKHAHSWCEVLLQDVESFPDENPPWTTLDPTPAFERDASVARVGSLAGIRQLTDFVRYIWIFYIVGFNSERQQRFLYQPIRRLIFEASQGFQMMGQALRSAADWLFHFPSVGSFISLRGFVVSFVGLLLAVGLARIGYLIVRRFARVWRGSGVDQSALAIGVLFYRRLVNLLEEYGLERPPAETPREFARRASAFLAGKGTGNEAVADVPSLVVDAYYRIRFGNVELDPQTLQQLEFRLDSLESKLRPTST